MQTIYAKLQVQSKTETLAKAIGERLVLVDRPWRGAQLPTRVC